MILTRILFLALALLPVTTASAQSQAPARLRLDYLENPLGIDERKPRFSFELVDPRRGAVQSAYHILVARTAQELEEDKGAIWDSGKVLSDATCQIDYGGTALEPWTRYFWKVRSYDGENKASPWSATAGFSTGALTLPDWSARWIEDPTPQPAYRKGSMGWRSQPSKAADDYKWVTIDVGEGGIWDRTRLYPVTTGKRGERFPLKVKIFGSDRPDFDSFSTAFRVERDKNDLDLVLPATGPIEFENTSRMKMRYVRVGIYLMRPADAGDFSVELAEVELLDGTQVVSRGRPVTVSDSIDGEGWSAAALVDGVTESNPSVGEAPIPATTLRREFTLRAAPAYAWLSCSAQGLYEARINGFKVGDAVLAPGWNDYRSRVFGNTYDVTALLRAGPNAIGVLLGDGWYSGRVGLAHLFPDLPPRGIYGRKPKFFGQLRIEYADGSSELITTDEEWKSTLGGPILFADILDGEHHDARRELTGFDQPGFDDKTWGKAALVTGFNPGVNAARMLPVVVREELFPVSVQKRGDGVWIYDFGRNMAGWCRLGVEGPAGTQVKLRYAEALQPDGSIYVENLRTAAQTDLYVLKGGGKEVWEPRFTYHGFRYVQVESPVAIELVARPISNAAPDAGEFRSNNPTLNALWKNIGNTFRSNYLGYPTDSPQRDERLGWTGDAQIFAPTAMQLADMPAFFTKWMQDVRDGYSAEYRFPDMAPHPFDKNSYFTGGPGWADAGVLVTYQMWLRYGDRRIIDLMLPFATRWLDAVRTSNPQFVFANERANDYGDWLNGSQINAPGWDTAGCEVPKDLFATAYWAHSAELVGELSAAIGKDDIAIKAFEMRDAIAAAFQSRFLSADGSMPGDTQAGYALALAFNLVPANLVPQVSAKLGQAVTIKRPFKLTTGFPATIHALMALSNHNGGEAASRIVRDRSFPGWGWQLDQGATTMWERWDGYSRERGFQDPAMNSLNHCAFASVGEWMMHCVAGIEPDREAPGFARFLVHPRCGIQIPTAGGRYHSIRGIIDTQWTIADSRFQLSLTVPPNTSATVIIPAKSLDEIRESGKPLAEAAPHVVPILVQDGKATLDVRAGSYRFDSAIP